MAMRNGLHAPKDLLLGKTTGTKWRGGCLGPRVNVVVVKKVYYARWCLNQ